MREIERDIRFNYEISFVTKKIVLYLKIYFICVNQITML